MFEVRQVTTAHDLERVNALIYRVYVRDGYIRNGMPSPFAPYLERKTTIILGAYVDNEIVGTVSCIPSTEPLPMGELFKDEIDVLGAEGKSIGEVCQFVVDREHEHIVSKNIAHTDVSTELLAAICAYGIRAAFHGFCLAVNPKHASFYRHIGCTEIGPEKTYTLVENAPAIPFYFDLQLVMQAEGKAEQTNFLLYELAKRIRKRSTI